MAVTALAIAITRNLFAAAMLFGIFSLLSAAAFVVLDAVDVAFTEAAVGAGISTILMLATLARTASRQREGPRLRAFPLALAAGLALILAWASADRPRFAAPDAPANVHVAPRYLAQGPEETGVPNVVTAVLASYRGYDTLGEVTVIFTAGVGVLALLAPVSRRFTQRATPQDPHPQPGVGEKRRPGFGRSRRD